MSKENKQLNAETCSVLKFLSAAENDEDHSVFVIPRYQRPYRWSEDECAELWEDIVNFFNKYVDCKIAGKKFEEQYFFGTVVLCPHDNDNDVEIIDGQQRVTSFMLMLRAIYQKLDEHPKPDETVKNFKEKIGKCLWQKDMFKNDPNKEEPNIRSEVAGEKDGGELFKILKLGNAEGMKSQYAQNYRYFYGAFTKFFASQPDNWQEIGRVFLNYCYVLPIRCWSLESALRIFNTLNDRGMQLADADIFKSKIYEYLGSEAARTKFTEQWNELSETATSANLKTARVKSSLDNVFRLYSYVIRSREKEKSKEGSLRDFYLLDDARRLKNPAIMDELISLADFWDSLNVYSNDYVDADSSVWLHCLQEYPNDYWRILLSVAFFTFTSDELKVKLPSLMRKILAELIYLFLKRPTLDSLKGPVMDACIELFSEKDIKSFVLPIDPKYGEIFMKKSCRGLDRCLLLLNSYIQSGSPYPKLHQLKKIEIEHILPKNWGKGNYNGWTKSKAEEFLEQWGNRIPIEKAVNIQVTDNYFEQKKKGYVDSANPELKALGGLPQEAWTPDDVKKRGAQIELNVSHFLETELPVASAEGQLSCPAAELARAVITVLADKGVIADGKLAKLLDPETLRQSMGGLHPVSILKSASSCVSEMEKMLLRCNYFTDATVKIGTMKYYITKQFVNCGLSEVLEYFKKEFGVDSDTAHQIFLEKKSH